jgi:hypothetical protein
MYGITHGRPLSRTVRKEGDMVLVQVDHRRLERLLAIDRTIYSQLSLCAVLMRWARETGDMATYKARRALLTHLQMQRAIYSYLIGREWDRINGITSAGEAIRVAFGG